MRGFTSYKKIEWNERIYFPSKLSRSNIDNRYKNDEKNDALIIRKKKMKQAKKEKKNTTNSAIIRSDLNEIEIKAIESKDIKDFMELLYGDVIRDYLKQIEIERNRKQKRKKNDNKQ